MSQNRFSWFYKNLVGVFLGATPAVCWHGVAKPRHSKTKIKQRFQKWFWRAQEKCDTHYIRKSWPKKTIMSQHGTFLTPAWSPIAPKSNQKIKEGSKKICTELHGPMKFSNSNVGKQVWLKGGKSNENQWQFNEISNEILYEKSYAKFMVKLGRNLGFFSKDILHQNCIGFSNQIFMKISFWKIA